MKKTIILNFLLVLILNSSFAQIEFNNHFEEKSLRFDYFIGGNADTAIVFFKELKNITFWGGSKINLIDTFNIGEYQVLVFDSAKAELIYSRGYSNLFKEWQSTAEAKKINKSYSETVIIPFPKKTIKLELQVRLKNQTFAHLYEIYINRNDYFISKEKIPNYDTLKISGKYTSDKSLDIAFIPEGYTENEMDKFHEDAKRFMNYTFEVSPFSEFKENINFWLINAPSEESGSDIPGDSVWKKTLINSHFYTFNIERYLTSPDIHEIRNIAACVPYDQIFVLVNTEKYGGSGIFNSYNICTADHPQSREVFTHEFGHGFAALADEYYTSNVAYEDLYDFSVEIYNKNITTLVEFDKKWKNMLNKDTPIPTPQTKEYKDKLGVFEGGGYVSKGIYRPTFNCKMKSNSTNEFCPVCNRAVKNLLLFYTK